MTKIIPLLAGLAIFALVGATGCAQKTGSDGETYSRIPAKVHKEQFPNGHDADKSCFYDEKEDVYFCSY